MEVSPSPISRAVGVINTPSASTAINRMLLTPGATSSSRPVTVTSVMRSETISMGS